ncbi:MAG TPA: HEAT repeat domain-containing protein [Candidatus Binataceae bacterium]|jgi:HEAT repeat protein|nr:HEAT repeat domain-containing protein [Candidatus Binataceae bacterium]
MSRAGLVLATALVASALMLPQAARAQMIGRPGYGGNRMSLQGLDQAGPGSLKRSGKSADEAIRDAKRKFNDADPRVRVQGLEGLRFVDSKDANEILFRGVSDPDVRVRIKAIDVLGARGVSDAVPIMSQELFLRETPAVEKLHLVAALGRIGDQRGAMPIVNYLKQTDDSPSRGTAVYAVGEIGDPAANDTLIQIVSNDPSPMVRKLAREAIEKIDGELPNRHQAVIEAEKQKATVATDEKLSKMRAIDAEIQAKQY